MPKHRALLVLAGHLLAPGCLLGTNTSDGDADGTSTTTTTGTTTTTTSTTTGTTTDSTDATATTAPTTTSATTTSTTTSATTTTTTSPGNFGQCGWDPNNGYYGCGFQGVDPDGDHPLTCPETLPATGAPCDGDSPISNIGCCLPDGTNYYCSSESGGMIVVEACGP
ncbi:hypothetical protein [Nannocystis bainbridge]|uniref:Uncharacterized protein n=1 Tax=Nannocystis bainbridge TaxID=2995303 RepID=A0ABT5E711_9BACT|nr:hypothetical protein [Nannocystis bainbridge]MDC0721213.1 hypothetical protein [Nannocystis bainbridge]